MRDWNHWTDVFTDLLGAGSVSRDEADLLACAVDETHDRRYLPDLVLKPRTVEEVAAVMKTCHDADLPVTPRGGGSGVSGGALAVTGGVILCLERLNQIVAMDKRNMTVKVQTGAITGEVQQALIDQGLCLPPDPGSKSWCQIGGNLAEAAAGPKSVKYGAFRDYVLNLQVVLPNGEIIWTGADVRKFASGYNLTQLMLGSEGTLGVITQVLFKVIPAPTEELVLRLAFTQLDQACEYICRLFEAGLTPSEVEFMEADAIGMTEPFCSEPAGDGVAAFVWVGFDGSRADLLMEDAERAAELAEEFGCDEPLFADEADKRQQLWTYRHQVGPAIIETTTFRDVDLSFPRGALNHIITGVKQIGAEHGFRTAVFGHAGDGNVHINVLRDDLDDETWNHGAVIDGIKAMYQLAIDAGGALSGEHGIGCTLLDYLDTAYSPTHQSLMRGIKAVFDPKGILNPGKIVAETTKPL